MCRTGFGRRLLKYVFLVYGHNDNTKDVKNLITETLYISFIVKFCHVTMVTVSPALWMTVRRSNITKFWIVSAERANHGFLLQAKTAFDLLATARA
jgi:hypothetical protein